MKKLLLPVLTYTIFISYCIYMVWFYIYPAKAQEDTEECLTRQEIIDMVRADHNLYFLRPVIGPYVDRAIAFFYTQVKLDDNSKYFTTALLVDRTYTGDNGRKQHGGMLIVGTDQDSYCSWATIPEDTWETVEHQLEGVWA